MRETLGTALQERGATIEELHHTHKSGEIPSLLDIILQKIQEGIVGHTESPHERNTVTRHMKNTGGKAGTDLSRNMQPNCTTHG